MRLSEFNASLPKREETERDIPKRECLSTVAESLSRSEKALELCQKEIFELKDTVKRLLNNIEQEK